MGQTASLEPAMPIEPGRIARARNYRSSRALSLEARPYRGVTADGTCAVGGFERRCETLARALSRGLPSGQRAWECRLKALKRFLLDKAYPRPIGPPRATRPGSGDTVRLRTWGPAGHGLSLEHGRIAPARPWRSIRTRARGITPHRSRDVATPVANTLGHTGGLPRPRRA